MFPCHLQFLLFGNQIRFGITENIIFCGIFTITISLFFEVAGNHKTSLRNYRIEAYIIPHSVFFGIQLLTELTSLAGQHVIHLDCPNKRNGKAINTPGKDLYDTLRQSDIGFSYLYFRRNSRAIFLPLPAACQATHKNVGFEYLSCKHAFETDCKSRRTPCFELCLQCRTIFPMNP